ncbi:response regulator [Planctomycetales bacterium ZRK34]|nr:response regulator [Planctomycetales bacterium ZRK34]
MRESCHPKILVIDNDEGVVKAISTRLDALGYDCVTASTGAQGLSLFSDQAIDLVITDLNMPMLDGAFLLTEIRAISQVPVIVITGFGHAYAQALAGQTNVTVLRKPFDASALIDVVELELAQHADCGLA